MKSAQILALESKIAAGDTTALTEFWKAAGERGTPLVEPIAGAPDHLLVTFVYRCERAGHVVVLKGPEDPRSALLERLAGSDVWAGSYRIPADGRVAYSFAPDFPLTRPSMDEWPKLERRFRADPLNPRRIGLRQSLLELSGAPASPWTEPAENVAAGEVFAHAVTSKRLGNRRRIYVYTPPGYEEGGGPYPLVVLFDGFDYLSGIPAATILDNLIAQKRLPPTMALLIDPVDRFGELNAGEAFTEVVACELVPFVQRRYRATADPSAVVVGGFSIGGLGAVWSAFTHPEVFGNALAQSDARSPRPDGLDVYEWVAQKVAAAPRKPIRFLLEEGHVDGAYKLDWPHVPFRYLHPVLSAKGYPVTVRAFSGGHLTTSWRVRLGDALVELLAGARPQPATARAPTDDLTVEDLGPSLLAAVLRAAARGGADGALRAFREQRGHSPDLDESMLETLGFELLYTAGLPPAAVAIFEERVACFPSSANAHASLAEASYVAGDRAGAISSCRKSLALAPENENTASLLEQLESP